MVVAGSDRRSRRMPAERPVASRRRPRPEQGSGGGKAGAAPPDTATAAHRPALEFAKVHP